MVAGGSKIRTVAEPNFEEFTDALADVATVDDIHNVCVRFCETYEFGNFIYGACIPTSLSRPYMIYISGYPKAWRTLYNERHFVRVDPTVHHCAAHITPVRWDRLTSLAKENSRIREFFGEAEQHGLVSGISFPVHTARGESAMFSLASHEQHERATRKIEKAAPYGQMFTAYLHEAVRRVFADELLPITGVRLTEREKQCLLWCAEGKTSWETARILGISERTVLYHIQNVTEKLNVSSRAQAVARAVSLGLISPQLD